MNFDKYELVIVIGTDDQKTDNVVKKMVSAMFDFDVEVSPDSITNYIGNSGLDEEAHLMMDHMLYGSISKAIITPLRLSHSGGIAFGRDDICEKEFIELITEKSDKVVIIDFES